MADVSAFTSIPLSNVDPTTSAKSAVDLGNALTYNALLKQNITNAGIAGQTSQQQLNTTHANRAATTALSLINSTNDPQELEAGIRQSFMDSLKNGTIDQRTFDVANSQVKPGQPLEYYNDLLKRHALTALSAPDAFKTAAGGPLTVNNGQQTVGAMQNGLFGPNPGGLRGAATNGQGGIQMQLSPGESAGMVTVERPDGSKVQMTAEQWARTNGTSGTPGGSVPPMAAPGNRGGIIVHPQGQPAPVQAPAAPSLGGFSTATPQSRDQANASAAYQTQQRAYYASPQYQTESQAWNTIRNIGPYANTGEGTQAYEQLKSVLSATSPDTLKRLGLGNINLETADRATVVKAFNQIANASGAGSDAQLAVTQGANPSAHINPVAVQRIAGAFLGQRDMDRVVHQSNDAASNNPADPNSVYLNNVSQQKLKLDPMGFRARYMSPEEITKYYNSLKSEAAILKFKKSMDLSNANPPVNSGELPLSATPYSR